MSPSQKDGWSNNWENAVGYKKPPKHSQFQAGQSGNKNGRPRKKKGNLEFLDDALNGAVRVTENGKTKTISRKQLIYKVLVANAIKGNARASAQLFKLMQEFGMMENIDLKTREIVIKFVKPDRET
jgi:hypothetical protein